MWIGWILSALSIIGALLNVKMIKWGFVFWIVANIGWVGFNLLTNTYEQIPIWIIFTIISAWGFWKWHTKEQDEDEEHWMHKRFNLEIKDEEA